jgi:hypothetical protein
MRVSQVFTQGGGYGWYGCGDGCYDYYKYHCDEWGCYDRWGGYHWRCRRDYVCGRHLDGCEF